MCCVALLAIATTWIFRSSVLLFARLGIAVVMAATAFSTAIFVAEHLDHYRTRSLATDSTILSEIVTQPVHVGETALTIAAVASAQPVRE
jgi:hypothetical protein